jgi:L-galactose dehydrogenase/L-glyceraldehyde 3-phosphate reductase
MIRGSHKEQVEAVELALSLGINYFDTAPSYGNGKSESNLGKVLSELEPNIVLASKVRPSLEQLDDISDAVERSVEASLNRLQRDYVDILYLHSRITMNSNSSDWPQALSISDVLGENGVADILDSLRRQGKTRFIGLTGLGETTALHKVIKSERFDVVQAYFNLLNPSAGHRVPDKFSAQNFKQLIIKASKSGMGVVAIRVMAAGAVGGDSSREGYAAPSVGGVLALGAEYEKDQIRSSRLDFLLQGEIQSLPQAALKFVLMHPMVSTALVGFSDHNQIIEAAETTEFNPLPQMHIAKLQDLWSKST